MIPIATSIGYALMGLGGAGAIGYSLFGKKKDKADPLAGIRAQLQSLATEVPGLVEKQKQRTREIFGEAEDKGLKDIAEEYQATKGFGPMSTMERGARRTLLDDIARSLASEELAAEKWGLSTRAGILGTEASIPYPEEEESFASKLLGLGGQLFGQEVGYGGFKDLLSNDYRDKDIENIIKKPSFLSVK